MAFCLGSDGVEVSEGGKGEGDWMWDDACALPAILKVGTEDGQIT